MMISCLKSPTHQVQFKPPVKLKRFGVPSKPELPKPSAKKKTSSKTIKGSAFTKPYFQIPENKFLLTKKVKYLTYL